MTNNITKPKQHAFLRQLVDRTFQRIIRGDFNYEEDNKLLNKYLEQAQQLDATVNEAQILNSLAALHMMSGEVKEAMSLFWKTHDLFLSLENEVHVANSLNNIGMTHIIMGNYDEALAHLNNGLNIIEKHENFSILRLLLSNKIEIVFVQEDWATLDELLQQAQSIVDKINTNDKHEYSRHMSEIYRVIAEREMFRGDYHKATRHINLAEELANTLSLTFELAKIHATRAHIVLKQDQNVQMAEKHWEQMENIIKDVNAPVYVGQIIVEEARYLKRRGYPQKATYFAEKAIELFETAEMTSYATLAQEVLETISVDK